jgi:hypothetical protein
VPPSKWLLAYLVVLFNGIDMNNTPQLSEYLYLYQYLQELSEEQIIKLRKIAIGILKLSAFSKEEIDLLEKKRTIDVAEELPRF